MTGFICMFQNINLIGNKQLTEENLLIMILNQHISLPNKRL